MSFEDDVTRLQRIIAELESDKLPLDDALRLFEEGVQRLRAAAGELSRTEERVKVLIERSQGAFELPELDA